MTRKRASWYPIFAFGACRLCSCSSRFNGLPPPMLHAAETRVFTLCLIGFSACCPATPATPATPARDSAVAVCCGWWATGHSHVGYSAWPVAVTALLTGGSCPPTRRRTSKTRDEKALEVPPKITALSRTATAPTCFPAAACSGADPFA